MKRLKDWLDKSDLSQVEFAKSLGVSQATVWEWLNGKTSPSFDRLSSICRKTGIPLEALVEDCARNVRARREQRHTA